MTEQKRVPYGSEQKTAAVRLNHCPSCRVVRGSLHKPGCSEEECPCCHGFVIGCQCNCLSTLDSTLIIQALYRQFTDLYCALQAANLHENNEKKGTSYLVHAAMQYLFEHIDEKSRDEINKKILISVPILKPSLYDEDGTGYYTSEQLAKAFDVSVEEINDRIEALSSAGFVIKKNEIENLKKSH